MNLFRSLSGQIRLRLTSADVPGMMEKLRNADIPMEDIRIRDEFILECTVSRENIQSVCRVVKKRNEQLDILDHYGLIYRMRYLLHRPVLMFGILFITVLILWLPTRVMFIRVEGNNRVTVNRILEAAEDCGIRFGASRREVRSEKMKNALLEKLPLLQWAGVNTEGCVATISVRERPAQPYTTEDPPASGIRAARDGIILSVTATKGNLLCTPGQAVSQGQLLISGYVDSGLSIRFTGAAGEIFAQTRREFSAKTPANTRIRRGDTVYKRKFSLLVGKKRINLWKDSGIWDVTCGRIYSDYYVTLPGNYVLPFGVSVETFIKQTTERAQVPEQEAQQLLRSFAEGYLRAHMVAGKILSQQTEIFRVEDCDTLAGEYVCTEMIGMVQREQIGEYNGENR